VLEQLVVNLVAQFRAKLGTPNEWISPDAPLRRMDAKQLKSVNQLVPWKTYSLDHLGRRVGRQSSFLKRADAQVIHDERINNLNSIVELKGATVTEFGCLEGFHTIQLAELQGQVTGVDARIENLVKTHLRSLVYGHSVKTILIDLDDMSQLQSEKVKSAICCDVLVHIGVLYHLTNPIKHLELVLPTVRRAILLDTHHSNTSNQIYVREFGRHDIYSGMSDSSLWLSKDEILQILRANSFEIRSLTFREETNGPRLSLVAIRT